MFFWNQYFIWAFSSMALTAGLFSGSQVIIWIFIELLTMLFLFSLIHSLKKYVSYEFLGYFLIHSISGLLLIYSLSLKSFFLSWLGLLALFLKLGIFPFHYWYIWIIKKLDWVSIFMLSTILKILPLKLMMSYNEKLIFLMSVMNISFSSMNILKEKNIKVIIGWSSLFNLSWTLFALKNSLIWGLYFSIYAFNLFSLLKMISMNFSNNMNDTSQTSGLSLLTILLIVVIMMGVPPFTGFMLKLTIINYLSYNFIFSALILILSIFFAYIYFMMGLLYLLTEKKLLFSNLTQKQTITFYKFLFFNISTSLSFLLIYY